MLQFLAVTEDAGARALRRVPIEGDLQATLSREFQRQRAEFRGEDPEIIPYEPGYKPDDELFLLENYPLPDYLQHGLDTRDAIAAVTSGELEGGQVKAVLGLAMDAKEPRLVCQNFDAGQVLHRGRKFLFLDRETFQESERTGLRLANKATALIEDGHLYFRSEFLVRRYLELDRIFEEATEREIVDFLRHERLSPLDIATFTAVADPWIRRKVTSIGRRAILDRAPVRHIVSAGRDFGIDVRTTTSDGKRTIVVPDDKKGIKSLLRLLDDDLLESALTDARYQVSSKRRLALP